ncbi:MAG: DUF5683 domain-containing protein [bacterium]
MKKLIIVGLVVSLAMGIANMAFAQEEKNPSAAVLWSLLVTGGGQIYNKETIKGILMLGGTVVCAATMFKEETTRDTYSWGYIDTTTTNIQVPQLIAILGLKIWSMVDAYQVANKFNDNLEQSHRVSLLLDEKKAILAYKCSF